MAYSGNRAISLSCLNFFCIVGCTACFIHGIILGLCVVMARVRHGLEIPDPLLQSKKTIFNHPPVFSSHSLHNIAVEDL